MKSVPGNYSIISYGFMVALTCVTGAVYLVFKDLGNHPFFWMMISLDGLLIIGFILALVQKPRQLQIQKDYSPISQRRKR